MWCEVLGTVGRCKFFVHRARQSSVLVNGGAELPAVCVSSMNAFYVLVVMMLMAGCTEGTDPIHGAVAASNQAHTVLHAAVSGFNFTPIQLGSMNAVCTALPVMRCGVWLGYEWNSTLGYDGEGPRTATSYTHQDHIELEDKTNLWLEQVAQEVTLLEALQVVQRIDFNFDDTDPNLNYVKATLWCCWEGDRFKRVKESVDQTGKKPTHLEAARKLRETLTAKHCCEAHRHHPALWLVATTWSWKWTSQNQLRLSTD